MRNRDPSLPYARAALLLAVVGVMVALLALARDLYEVPQSATDPPIGIQIPTQTRAASPVPLAPGRHNELIYYIGPTSSGVELEGQEIVFLGSDAEARAKFFLDGSFTRLSLRGELEESPLSEGSGQLIVTSLQVIADGVAINSPIILTTDTPDLNLDLPVASGTQTLEISVQQVGPLNSRAVRITRASIA